MEKKYPTWDLFKAKYPSEQLQRDRFEDLVRSPVFVNGTPKSFATVLSYQIIDSLLVFIHLHDGSPLPARLRKRIG